MMHIADRFILDMAVEGDACEIELSPAAHAPVTLEFFETDSYGCWRVLSVMRIPGPESARGMVVRAVLSPIGAVDLSG
jgi:hypothetical protein